MSAVPQCGCAAKLSPGWFALAFLATFLLPAVEAADQRQNEAVRGTAAQLAAAGFGNLTGAGQKSGLMEGGQGIPSASMGVNPLLPAARFTFLPQKVGEEDRIRNHAS